MILVAASLPLLLTPALQRGGLLDQHVARAAGMATDAVALHLRQAAAAAGGTTPRVGCPLLTVGLVNLRVALPSAPEALRAGAAGTV